MRSILLGFLFLLSSHWVGAWGKTGHMTVGWIAEQHLNSKARKKLKELLKGESVANAGTWMDDIRSNKKYNYMTDWHWVTIPDGQTYEVTEKNSRGDIIEAMSRVTKSLKSGALKSTEEKTYVKILIHLVGDIHQPLHIGTGKDKGGNDIKVKWFGHKSNLHRVWDSEMIDDTKLSYTELALSLGEIPKSKVTSLQKTSVYDWTNESMRLRNQIYKIGNGNLGNEYFHQNMNTVRERLLEAGVRLAGLLNEIYG